MGAAVVAAASILSDTSEDGHRIRAGHPELFIDTDAGDGEDKLAELLMEESGGPRVETLQDAGPLLAAMCEASKAQSPWLLASHLVRTLPRLPQVCGTGLLQCPSARATARHGGRRGRRSRA